MRRPHLTLTEAEAWALIERTAYGVLAVHGTEGYPYAVPMNHVVIDGGIVFHAAVEGHRLEALRADPRACFTVTVGPEEDDNAIPAGTLGTFSSAVVFGRVSELPLEEQEKALIAFVQRHLPERVEEVAQFMASGRKVAALRMKAEHISGKRLVVR